ncbi:MAG: type II toxin-antitoxin system VapC family toxin [Bacteroidia bacterium]|nr:type II toxin-antitoxin system VapC family toxin [Bacteroidia bacterium]
MRYLLDTNILIFFALGDTDNLSKDVCNVLFDYSNLLYTSSLCIMEMVYLYKNNKIKTKFKSAEDMVYTIEKLLQIEIIHTKPEHIFTYSRLKTASNHNDQIDHFIIAQAITEKMPLISSDHKFNEYIGLNFVYNRR